MRKQKAGSEKDSYNQKMQLVMKTRARLCLLVELVKLKEIAGCATRMSLMQVLKQCTARDIAEDHEAVTLPYLFENRKKTAAARGANAKSKMGGISVNRLQSVQARMANRQVRPDTRTAFFDSTVAPKPHSKASEH